MWKLLESKEEYIIPYDKHGYLNTKTTSHPWKIKHTWKHVMETKLKSYLHELNPLVENHPKDWRVLISKNLSEAS